MLDAKAIPLSHDYDLAGAGDARPHRSTCPAPGSSVAARPTTAAQPRSAPARTTTTGPRQGNPGWDAADGRAAAGVGPRPVPRPPLPDGRAHLAPRRPSCTPAQAVGLPFADDLDDIEAGVGIGPMPVNIVDGVRWNARSRSSTRSATCAHLHDRRRHDRDRGCCSTARPRHRRRGRRTRRAAQRVRAEAGRRGGRRLPLPGAAAALRHRAGRRARGLGIEVVVDRPGVGRHLLDHACVAARLPRHATACSTSSPLKPVEPRRADARPRPVLAGATTGPTTSTSSWSPAPTAATPGCRRSACTAAPCAPGPRVA